MRFDKAWLIPFFSLVFFFGCSNSSSSPTNTTPSSGSAAAILTKYTWSFSDNSGRINIFYCAPDGTGLQYIFTDQTRKQISGYSTFSWLLTQKDLNGGKDTLLIGSNTIPILLTSQSLVLAPGPSAITLMAIDSVVPGMISGLIFDSTGRVLSGVTVDNSNIRTTTDAFGNYSFTQLATGGYVITPQLTGYQFTPQSKNVSASATVGAINVDFQATPHATVDTTKWYFTAEIDMPDSVHSLVCYNAKIAPNKVGTMTNQIAVIDDHLGYDTVIVMNASPNQIVKYNFAIPKSQFTVAVNFWLAGPDPSHPGKFIKYTMPHQVFLSKSAYIQIPAWGC